MVPTHRFGKTQIIYVDRGGPKNAFSLHTHGSQSTPASFICSCPPLDPYSTRRQRRLSKSSREFHRIGWTSCNGPRRPRATGSHAGALCNHLGELGLDRGLADYIRIPKDAARRAVRCELVRCEPLRCDPSAWPRGRTSDVRGLAPPLSSATPPFLALCSATPRSFPAKRQALPRPPGHVRLLLPLLGILLSLRERFRGFCSLAIPLSAPQRCFFFFFFFDLPR